MILLHPRGLKCWGYAGSGGRRKGKKPSRLYRSVPGYQFLPEGSLSFRKHSPRQSADIRIAGQGCPEEFSAGFLLSITAPHYTTQKYIVAVHFILSVTTPRSNGVHCCLAFVRDVHGIFYAASQEC